MENFSITKQVRIPAKNTGIVIGAILIKNSINSQPAIVAINKFCGSPTKVQTPPRAVPTAPCITRSLKKALNSSNSSIDIEFIESLLWKSCVSSENDLPDATA